MPVPEWDMLHRLPVDRPVGPVTQDTATIETIGIGIEHEPLRNVAAIEAPAMCPWRSPEKDLRAFFPRASGYRPETLVLSPLRLEIQRRLGAGVRLESNALYIYRVEESAATMPPSPCGAFLVRRASGEYGAIEVVVAVGMDRRVVGVRLQRHREPPPAAGTLASARWLGAFNGKSAASAFRSGEDLPVVSLAAKRSCEAVAGAVRSLLIEYDASEEHRLPYRRAAAK